MNIIYQNCVFVKCELQTAPRELQEAQEIAKKSQHLAKFHAKKEKNMAIAKRVEIAGYEERAARMRLCGTALSMKYCPSCGKSHVSSANLCRDRLCPTCEWRLSMKRFAEMCQTFSLLNDLSGVVPSFLTLTVRNCSPEDLGDTLKAMAADWNRMIARRTVKKKVVGWAKCLEITYNWRAGTFHPHYHIIMLLDTENTERDTEGYLHSFFRQAWQESSRLDYEPITDFRFIRNKETGEECHDLDHEKFTAAILETYKYAVKSDDIEEMPIAHLRHMIAAIASVRFCSFGGVIKQARAQAGIVEKDEADEDEYIPDKCECGGDMVEAFMRWSFTEKMYKVYYTEAHT